MKIKLKLKNSQTGFTLVELSIVLVIIGLIIGGVLVGQDLIKAAKIRAMVNQIQQLDAGKNTFRTKYNAFPGDITPNNSNSFGLGNFGGNGDGVIRDATNDNSPYAGEVEYFWTHMRAAALVAGEAVPTTKLGKGHLMQASRGVDPYLGGGSLLYYTVLPARPTNGGPVLFSCTGAANSNTATCPVMTPYEVYGIDSKMDDGASRSGIVKCITGANNPGDTDSIAGQANGVTPCSDGNSVYDVDNEVNTSTFWIRSQ